MTKQDYRNKIKKEYDFPYSEKALIKALSECDEFTGNKIILSYRPIKGEIDLTILESVFKDKVFLYPVVKDNDMIFVSSQKFIKNKWGIEEPIGEEFVYQKALMITPALCYDSKCFRLGRGKGFYDRYIKKNRTKLFTLGIGKENQLVENLPVDSFDQKLNEIIILSRGDESFWSLT